MQSRKCRLGLAGGESSPSASSRTHFTAETIQTTSDAEIFKVKEPMNSLDANGTLIPKADCALVKAALQTAPEDLLSKRDTGSTGASGSPPLAVPLPQLDLAWLGPALFC